MATTKVSSAPILVFFEDDAPERFYPLSLSHPPASLLCGALTLAEKWSARIKHSKVAFSTREHLHHISPLGSGSLFEVLAESPKRDVYLLNPRFLAGKKSAAEIVKSAADCAFYSQGELVGCKVSSNKRALRDLLPALTADREEGNGLFSILSQFAAGLEKIELDIPAVRYLWDLVALNGKELANDVELLRKRLKPIRDNKKAKVDRASVIYQPRDVLVGAGARIDGQVVLDARGGPILIDGDVTILPHTRVEGPAYIGQGTRLVGGKIREGCSFGPHCRVGGEVEEAIFLGYTNKYHDGFIGHAYVGEWVNFGATTTNSDVKNNYGNVRIELPTGVVDTGLIKVGSFIGDHTKTGIGTLLTTGMVIGFSSNLFGGGLVKRKSLPSFVWGGADGFAEYLLSKAAETAIVAMSRRNREFADADQRLFAHLFEATGVDRNKLLESPR